MNVELFTFLHLEFSLKDEAHICNFLLEFGNLVMRLVMFVVLRVALMMLDRLLVDAKILDGHTAERVSLLDVPLVHHLDSLLIVGLRDLPSDAAHEIGI